MDPNLPVYSYDPSSGQMIVTYPDGAVIPLTGGSNGQVATGAGRPLPLATPASSAGTNGQSGNGYVPRSYTPRAPSSTPNGGGDSGQTLLPSYANGRQHPLADPANSQGASRNPEPANAERLPGSRLSGLPFTPSHISRSADSFGVRGENGPQGYGSSGQAQGGGGGGASSTYWRIRGKLEGTKAGQLASGGSSSSSYGGGSSYGSYPDPKEPKEPRMTGPYARGLDPDQALGLAYRPSAMIPRVFPDLGGATPLYQMMRNIPAYPLAILGKKNFSGSPKSVANSVGNFYANLGRDHDLPELGQLMGNLTNPKKGGGIAELFGGVPLKKGETGAYGSKYEYGKEPLGMGEAASTYQGLLDAILQTSLPQNTAAKYSGYGDYLIDKGSAKALKRPAGKGTPLYRSVGRRIFR